MRRDIKTGFPFEEVSRKDYRNVDRQLRAEWRLLRLKAKAYGFGWTTLEPIKSNGKVAARYLAKYLSKAQVSEFREGEERARLFGIWGRRRFVSQRFSWVNNRIFRQRLAWYAKDSTLEDVTEISKLLGRNWWLKLGRPLLDVVLPVPFYQVWDRSIESYVWDELGWRAYCADLSKYPEWERDHDRIRQSRFVFYCADGVAMGYSAERAQRYAKKKLLWEFGPQLPSMLPREGPNVAKMKCCSNI